MNRIVLSIILMSIFALSGPWTLNASEIYIPSRDEISQGDVKIIAGEEKTIFEYRVNGKLLLIKIVPDKGLSYYMLPSDGSAHYENLDHSKGLYPSWILFEW
ncbi:MAG: DUF2782 domain-containing protein [Pseudomonadales bacterium]|nr:DUF2782 domain-containing protein [Pseudomonadales bacterium]